MEIEEKQLQAETPCCSSQKMDSESMDDSQVQSLQSQLTQCQLERQDLKDKFLRVTADLQNFQQRVTKDQSMWYEMAQSKLLSALLPIKDDFDRAIKQPKTVADTDSWRDGIMMIHTKLEKFLVAHGVQHMTDYTTFNPEQHEALLQVESDLPSGHIVQVLEPGYLFKGMVLRPAKVSVAK